MLGDAFARVRKRLVGGALYQQDVEAAVLSHFGGKEVKKRFYSLYFQELLAVKAAKEFPETAKLFEALFSWLRASFDEA